MPTAVVWGHIADILDFAEKETLADSLEVAGALWEMADRQWHTYERLEPVLRGRLDDWIERSWDPTNLRLVRRVLGTIGMIGLPRSMDLVRKSLEEDLDPAIREEIEGAIREFGDTVDDPYSGMK